MSVAEGSHASP